MKRIGLRVQFQPVRGRIELNVSKLFAVKGIGLPDLGQKGCELAALKCLQRG